MMCRIVFAIFIILTCGVVNAGPVSKFAAETLSKSDLVLCGRPLKKIHLPNGGDFITFHITEVYKGQIAADRTIYLVYLLPPVFSENEQWVVFVRSLSSRYTGQALNQFSLKERDGPHKLQALKKLLEIEALPDSSLRKQAYLNYCLAGMAAIEPWTRAHAFQEWEYLFTRYKDMRSPALVKRLEQVYTSIPELSLRDRLKKKIITIKRHLSKAVPAVNGRSGYTSELFQRLQLAQEQLSDAKTIAEKIAALHFLGAFPCEMAQRALLRSLEDSSQHMRALAVFYLGRHGNATAVPALLSILQKDPSLRVRKNTIIALAKLNVRVAIPAIEKYLTLPYTRQAALQALQKLGSNP